MTLWRVDGLPLCPLYLEFPDDREKKEEGQPTVLQEGGVAGAQRGVAKAERPWLLVLSLPRPQAAEGPRSPLQEVTLGAFSGVTRWAVLSSGGNGEGKEKSAMVVAIVN